VNNEFFDSQIVKETMEELEDMQVKLIMNVLELPYYNQIEQKEYIQLLKDFLEKQKVLFFRMSLSDNPEAQATKNEIIESLQIFGWMKGQSLEAYFEKLEKSITDIAKSLEL